MLERLTAAAAVAFGWRTAFSPSLMSSLNIHMDTPRSCASQTSIEQTSKSCTPGYCSVRTSRFMSLFMPNVRSAHFASHSNDLMLHCAGYMHRWRALFRRLELTSWEASITEPVAKIQQRMQ